MLLLGTGWIIAIIVTVVLVGIMIALYIFGNKLQAKQMEHREQISAASQPATLFIIDKKIMPMKDAKLPKMVMEQAPKRYQKAKLPIVKAKVGPQIMTFICEEAIYDDVPSHGEVKAMVSGIYITSVRTLHKKTKKMHQEELENAPRKKSFREKMVSKQAKYQKQLDYEIAVKKTKEEAKKQKAELKKKKEKEKKITV
jgi:flagellar basal body-associated protein FliL